MGYLMLAPMPVPVAPAWGMGPEIACLGPEVPLPLLLALLPPDWGGMRGAVLASSLPSLGWGGMSGAVLA